jgi:hypothetical protein
MRKLPQNHICNKLTMKKKKKEAGREEGRKNSVCVISVMFS